ncbi:MAG: ferritin family protein [Chloroflexota bacterium]
MTEDLSEAISGLAQAMRIEQDGMRFYRQAKDSVSDERGKKMYASLLRDEEVHLRILQTEHDRLSKTGNWVSLDEAKQGGRTLTLFPDEVSGAIIFAPGMSDLDALKLAMDFEDKGYRLYDEAAKKATSLAAQGVYRFLAQQESQHFAVLQRSHSYLANDGVWFFDDMQSPQLDG